MDIVLYKNGSAVNAISKNLTDAYTVANVFFKDTQSVMNPSIVLSNFSTVFDYNYVYISQLKRYYFIENFTIEDGGRIGLNLKVDVLMSFKADILKSSVVVDRSTSAYNWALSDTVTAPWINGRYTYKAFSRNEFTSLTTQNESIVLVTIGGTL